MISVDSNERLDDLAPKADSRGYDIKGRGLLITRATNPNASKGDLESLVNGHKVIFDVIPEPDLDETTAELVLYHVGKEALRAKNCLSSRVGQSRKYVTPKNSHSHNMDI